MHFQVMCPCFCSYMIPLQSRTLLPGPWNGVVKELEMSLSLLTLSCSSAPDSGGTELFLQGCVLGTLSQNVKEKAVRRDPKAALGIGFFSLFA